MENASSPERIGEEITIDYTKEKLSEQYLHGFGSTYLFN